MKIVIVVTYTYPFVGSGIGNVALKQAEELASRGNEVTVVSCNYPKSESDFVKNKVRHLKLSGIRWLEKYHIPVPLFLFNKIAVDAIKHSDIVHIHDAVYPSSCLAAIIARIYHKDIIVTQHLAQVIYPSKMINLVQKIAYLTVGNITLALSKKIIYFNPEVKKIINNPTKEVWLPNGVDLKLFKPAKNLSEKTSLGKKYALPVDKQIVLFVGRLVPKKGFRMLFESKSDKYLIVFAGGGEIPKEMRINKEAIFLGNRTQLELSELYRLSDVFILPSYGEGFPLSVQEAMASGLPVITSKENIFDPRLSFIKTIDLSITNIKEAIIEVLNDKKVSLEMAVKSRTFVEKYASWE